MEHAYKSITHRERYYHFKNLTGESVKAARAVKAITVFLREERTSAESLNLVKGFWYFSLALCDGRDHFNRRTGRMIARRKFFQNSVTGRSLYELGCFPEKVPYEAVVIAVNKVIRDDLKLPDVQIVIPKDDCPT